MGLMRALCQLSALRQHVRHSLLQATDCTSIAAPLTAIWGASFPPPNLPASAHLFAASAQPLPIEDGDVIGPEPHPAPQPNKQPFPPLNFDDPRVAFRAKTSGELALAYGVFSACQVCVADPF